MTHARLLAFGVAALTGACAASPSPDVAPRVSPADFRTVAGEWAGTLTYLDYSPPFGQVTIAAEASVTEAGAGVELALRYPKEPKQNASSMMAITSNGAVLDGEPVVRRSREGATLVIATEADCQDNNQPARCEHTYSLAGDAFSIRKVVKPVGGPPFQRNLYSFRRKTP